MNTDLINSMKITLFADEQQNIVIFPYSKSTKKIPETENEYFYHVAYFPIELKYPFTPQDLADKIEFAINETDKHPCYEKFSGRNTFEEKYYNIQGFKNAIKGKKRLHLGWNVIKGKYVDLFLPRKRGYAYLAIEKRKLLPDADWIDFANIVIDLLNTDLTQLRSYKVFKSELNM